jgi:tetratricopeptide (TPR) repeat protein
MAASSEQRVADAFAYLTPAVKDYVTVPVATEFFALFAKTRTVLNFEEKQSESLTVKRLHSPGTGDDSLTVVVGDGVKNDPGRPMRTAFGGFLEPFLESEELSESAVSEFGRVTERFLVIRTDSGKWEVVDCGLLASEVLARARKNDFDGAQRGLELLSACKTPTAHIEAFVLLRKGETSYDQGVYEGATAALQRSLMLVPTAVAHYYLGFVYRDNQSISNNILRAMEEFRIAVAMSPKNADYHTALADAYRQAENYEGALTEFERALELDPWSIHARYFYAITLLAKGRMSEAATQLAEVVEQDPDYQNAKSLLARVRQNMSARAAYQRLWRTWR